MPELAEVEYYRKQWDAGLGQKVSDVRLHEKSRNFRETDPRLLRDRLKGRIYRASYAHGKNMLFQFSGGAWLGGHLGMSGKILVTPPDHGQEKHDHLVLVQRKQCLVFSDYRMFGRLTFHEGKQPPEWWRELPPEVLSREFSKAAFATHVRARAGSPVKGLLLDQGRLPGIGNWMADEILWKCGIYPGVRCRDLGAADSDAIWKATRKVTRDALRIIGTNWGDPPDSWLFNHRWKKGLACPRCGSGLDRGEIAGRTTCWCPRCQAEF